MRLVSFKNGRVDECVRDGDVEIFARDASSVCNPGIRSKEAWRPGGLFYRV